jgi:RHS repeat-associated protein
MTVIDGLVCTWDFKDRLVSVENNEMRANYTYDYTDRRVLKTVWPKAATNSPSTVMYINQYFEVREHDVPTKYVWNGEMRVARVTGSLNTNVRIQRLRVWRGWNLCSLAVTATNAVEQLTGSPTGLPPRGEVSEVRADGIFKWNPATLGWDVVLRGETLLAGTVLWLQATTNGVLTVTGVYSEPTNRAVTPAGDFLPSAGLAAWDFGSAMSNLPSASAWAYDTPSTRWLSWLPLPIEQRSGRSFFIAPGEAIFVRSEAPTVLEPPPHASALQFYHGDHLETVVSITDQAARLLEETAYYPFGFVRHGNSWQGTPDPYAFLQKERDPETSLHHLEARYYHAVLGRFVSLDPLANTPAKSAVRSSVIQPYGYGRANPLRYQDANGLSPNRPPTERELLMAFGISEREAGKAVNWYAQEVNDPETQRYLKSKGGKETFQDKSQTITLESTGEGKLKESRTTEEGEQASESTVEAQRLGLDTYHVESTEYDFFNIPKGERGAAKAALDKKPPPATKPTRPRAKIGPKFKVTIGPVTIIRPPAARPENIAGQTHPDFPGATTDPNYLIEHPNQVGNACEEW